MGWAALCKWIIHPPHRLPGSPQQATVWGTSRRGQLEAGVVSFYWPHHTGRGEDRDTEAWVCRYMSASACAHRCFSVSLWCLSQSVGWCFFYFFLFLRGSRGLTSCTRVASRHWMSERADSFHFPELSPWSEGHILGRGHFAHFLFTSPSLLLYTHGASLSVPASRVASIDRLTDLSLWKINRTILWVLFTLIFRLLLLY